MSRPELILAARAEVEAERAAAAGRPTLGDTLAAERLAVIRFRWSGPPSGPLGHRYDVQAYSRTCRRIPLDRATREFYVAGLFERWPYAVRHGDWDYLVAEGRLVAAPDVCDAGGIPEEDLQFGPHHSPMGAVA